MFLMKLLSVYLYVLYNGSSVQQIQEHFDFCRLFVDLMLCCLF